MCRIILLLFLEMYSCIAWAQYDNVWVFGEKAGIDFNGVVPVSIETKMNTVEACAMICNGAGELLFYTNGSTVWNRNHDTMQDGENLTGLATSVMFGPTSSSYQGVTIVQNPQNLNRYYVFSLTSQELQENRGRLYYSVVDMSLNNGAGAVLPNEKGIFIDSLFTESMICIAGNVCRQFWLVALSNTGVLKSYEITTSGINLKPVISDVTITGVNPRGGIEASMSISKQGNHLAIARGSKLTLYSFNPATGIAFDLIILQEVYTHDVAFSADGNKLYSLYFDQGFGLNQYNLSSYDSFDIVQSRKVISFNEVSFARLQLAPDDKIYVTKYPGAALVDTVTTLSVIHAPDSPGTLCRVELNAFHLLPHTRPKYGMPNTPKLIYSFNPADTIFSTLDTLICFAGSAVLSAPMYNSNYEWSTGTIASTINVSIPCIYWGRYLDSNCILHIDTFYVAFSNPDFSIRTANSCSNSNNGKAWIERTLNDSTLYTCTWKDEDHNILSIEDSMINIPAGDYVLEVITDLGCTKEFKVPIGEETHNASFTSDTLVCRDDKVHFTNTSDPHFIDFDWQFGDGGTSGLQNVSHIYKEHGVYQVMLTGKGLICTDTAYTTVVIDAPFEGLRYIAEPTEICEGRSVHFTPYSNDSTIATLHWQMGYEYAFTSSNTIVTHAYEKAGIYPVTLTAKFRICPDTSFTDTIKVFPIPVVKLSEDTFICIKHAPLILKNVANNPGIHNYSWSTGISTESIEVRHPGTYGLTVTTEQGCSNTGTIAVRQDCYADVPNVFTPNGDGINDYFFPRQLLSKGVSQFRMQVFNRWGLNVFSTTSTEGRGWDGRLNNREQPAGVYVYLIELRFDNGQQEKYEGNLTLVR